MMLCGAGCSTSFESLISTTLFFLYGGEVVSKVEKSRLEETFDLVLAHSDFVDMMNDPQVVIDEGTVGENQEFTLILKKSNGTEVILKELKSSDSLIVRFKKVTSANIEESFNDVDIS
jgi:hypothetical protein